MIIKLYQMRYEDGVYSIGTKDELIKNHNEWVENSGRFELDEINDNLATTLQDLDEHWIVEQIYTVSHELIEKISKENNEVEAK